jgi:hypothetical protein
MYPNIPEALPVLEPSHGHAFRAAIALKPLPALRPSDILLRLSRPGRPLDRPERRRAEHDADDQHHGAEKSLDYDICR